MLRREFTKKGCMTVLAGTLPTIGGAQDAANHIGDAGVEFRWQHSATGFDCTFIAPTSGWIAMGFNAQHSLRGTRFVMAVTSKRVLRWQERVARAPPGQNVQSLGLPEAFTVTSGEFQAGRSKVSVSVPRRIPSDPEIELSVGAKAFLMLAWSHETDFDHHSAWRKHYAINL